MSATSSECVLVVPAEVLHRAGLFQGFNANVEHYLPLLLNPSQLSYRPRSEVETDPNYKQLIPYAVLRCGAQVFAYVRGQHGGDTRLHALWSIGVGGHVCGQDAGPATAPYRTAMLRELAEEVDLDTPYAELCLGLINDDSTPVGQVHLGIVHIFDLERPNAQPREQALTQAGFAPLADLRRRRGQFETWSQILLAEGVL